MPTTPRVWFNVTRMVGGVSLGYFLCCLGVRCCSGIWQCFPWLIISLAWFEMLITNIAVDILAQGRHHRWGRWVSTRPTHMGFLRWSSSGGSRGDMGTCPLLGSRPRSLLVLEGPDLVQKVSIFTPKWPFSPKIMAFRNFLRTFKAPRSHKSLPSKFCIRHC